MRDFEASLFCFRYVNWPGCARNRNVQVFILVGPLYLYAESLLGQNPLKMFTQMRCLQFWGSAWVCLRAELSFIHQQPLVPETSLKLWVRQGFADVAGGRNLAFALALPSPIPELEKRSCLRNGEATGEQQSACLPVPRCWNLRKSAVQ